MARIKYTQCMIRDCEKPHMSKGFCNRHYQQMWKHGRILPDEMPIEDLPGELWADIEEAEGYQVSNMGRVKSLVGRGRLIKPQIEQRSHMNTAKKRVYLDRRATRGWVKFLYVHLEVAKAFIPNKFDSTHTTFKNGDALDCRADNIEWWWENPPVDDDGLIQFRKSVHSELGKKVLAFIDGNQMALDSFVMQKTDKMRKILQSKFKGTCGDRVNEAVHVAFSEGMRDIKRGLLRADTHIENWFLRIAENNLLDEIKKNKHITSQWGFNGNGDEFDKFDLMAATN
jgi:hypothetical protein